MNTEIFSTFLKDISNKPIKVIDKNIHSDKYVSIDISENNKDLVDFNVSSSKQWEKYINEYLSKNNARVAYGGYLEKRNLYNRSNYFNNQTKENQRNIHLGVDFWCKENTKVLAVLDGEIHSFKNNLNHGDYGPTIIIRHKIKSETFFSLYGHLSLESISIIKKGDKIKQGDVIGSLGDSTVNGDYAPHLHFQLIRNLEGNIGDYPGVCSEKDLDFYKKNCPDPVHLLKN